MAEERESGATTPQALRHPRPSSGRCVMSVMGVMHMVSVVLVMHVVDGRLGVGEGNRKAGEAEGENDGGSESAH